MDNNQRDNKDRTEIRDNKKNSKEDRYERKTTANDKFIDNKDKDNIDTKTETKTEINNKQEIIPENNKGLNTFNEVLYLDFKLYLNSIYPPTNGNLLQEEIENDFKLYQKINEFQYNEKNLFDKSNDDIIKKYFLCKQIEDFNQNFFFEKNKNITSEFRYFCLYLFFGNNNNNMLNFYSKLFLNCCKIIEPSILSNNLNQQNCLKHMSSLKDSLEWIYIIPCFEFPILKNELIKISQVNSFLIHCHGKHNHNDDYFKSFIKYKGTFHNHNELLELLNYINKKYKCPKFNYELENKDKYKIYDFSLNSNIRSNIESNFKSIYEKYYYYLDTLSPFYNKPNHLLLNAYFYYKDIYENKTKIDNNEINCFLNFLNIDSNIPLEEKYNLCKEFIPKIFLVLYYYFSYNYSNPFKMSKTDVKNNISKAEGNNNDKNKIYISIGEIIDKCYKKIINDESILREELINNFHELLIQLIIIEEGNYKIYQYIEALSNFDFCLEFILIFLYESEENDRNKKLEEICIVLYLNDRRMSMLSTYMEISEYNESKNLKNTELNEHELNEQQIEDWTEGLKIKNILIIYNDNDFYNKIKSINLPYRTIYLKPEQLDDFFEEREQDDKFRRIMKYYVIIDIKTGNELYNTFNYYMYIYGLTLIFIFLCESNSLIPKILSFGKKLSCICVSSTKDIEDYFYDLQNVYKFPLAINLNESRTLIGYVDDNARQLFPPINNNVEEDDNGYNYFLL